MSPLTKLGMKFQQFSKSKMLKLKEFYITFKLKNVVCCDAIVRTEIQWTSFFFFKMSLMIKFWTKILHIHIIKHRLIYNCIFEYL